MGGKKAFKDSGYQAAFILPRGLGTRTITMQLSTTGRTRQYRTVRLCVLAISCQQLQLICIHTSVEADVMISWKVLLQNDYPSYFDLSTAT